MKISKVQLTIGSKLGGKLGIFSERLSNSNWKEEKRNQYGGGDVDERRKEKSVFVGGDVDNNGADELTSLETGEFGCQES